MKTVSPQEAQQLLKDGYGYLDVRTEEEFDAGHVDKSINVPYKNRTESGGMAKNDKFTEQVLAKFEKNAKLIVACQGGVRSAAAVQELEGQEFTSIVDMSAGFGGWVRAGLPSTK